MMPDRKKSAKRQGKGNGKMQFFFLILAMPLVFLWDITAGFESDFSNRYSNLGIESTRLSHCVLSA